MRINRFPVLELSVFCLILVLLSFSFITKDEKSSEEKPNILFIAVDDLRPELGCYGAEHIQSPNIDQLAADGTVFQRAYCNVPVCGASRASLLTGLRPAHKRFLNFMTRADKDAPEAISLPSYLKKNGYQTISNGKIYHHEHDDKDSWDELWRAESNSKSWKDYALTQSLENETNTRGGSAYERADVEDDVYRDGKIAAKVIEDLRKLSQSDKPFFLGAGFIKPHLPFNAPEKYWKLYDGKVSVPYNNYAPENAPKQSLHNFIELRIYDGINKKGPVSDEMASNLIHGYYACVSYVDAQIGKVLDELERLELDENTIVVLWGDHGFNLLEHGLWCKTSSYETALHAPLIVKIPGKNKVKATSEIVEYVDIYPTICELAGLDLPEHLQGDSFKNLLYKRKAKSDGIAIAQWKKGLTVIKDNYFYTEWIDDKDSSVARMLYDHQLDKDENFNISEHAQNKSVIEELRKEIRANRGENYFMKK